MLGSLAGIGEIVKATFGDQGGPAGTPAVTVRRPTVPPTGRGIRRARHVVVDHFARHLELVHPGRRAAAARNVCAGRVHALARPVRHPGRRDFVRCRLVLADPDHRVCGVRGRADPGLATVCAPGGAAEPRARSSTAAPTDMSAASSRSTSRSSTASARSASTTPSGVSPGPIARPAAGSRLRELTAQIWRWKLRNSQRSDAARSL